MARIPPPSTSLSHGGRPAAPACARLEKLVLGKKAIMLKVMGRAIGHSHKEIDDKIKAVEDPAPCRSPCRCSISRRPTMRYAGLWSATKSYCPAIWSHPTAAPGSRISASTGLKPGDGVGWRLAVKSDTSVVRRWSERSRKQLGAERPPIEPCRRMSDAWVSLRQFAEHGSTSRSLPSPTPRRVPCSSPITTHRCPIEADMQRQLVEQMAATIRGTDACPGSIAYHTPVPTGRPGVTTG